jgi:tetratricopeptide (TPR) repeat protein
MTKHAVFAIFLALLTFILAGCKPAGPSIAANATNLPASTNYFRPVCQDESQFIVATIVSDLAEQIYYAKFHCVPNQSDFRVSAQEPIESSLDAPNYDVQVKLDNKLVNLTNRLDISGPIWSPEVYDKITSQLANLVGLTASGTESLNGTAMLSKLTDGAAETIEQENLKLSSALQDGFLNEGLHEKAALLLGAFALREHSGDFYDIRSPLCRITAHLALAHHLNGQNQFGINGSVAEAILYTLMHNQAEALKMISELDSSNPSVASWVRALQARNTGDYRQLNKLDGLSQIECINWFYALDRSANADIAWSKLSESQKRIPDFVRIANAGGYSVGMGHDLLELSLPLEFREIGSVYQLAQGKRLENAELVTALNQLPDRCFFPDANGQSGVRVIGWGLWAGFFQRQLCHAIQHNYDFQQRMWGVPDDAKTFADRCEQDFGGLRLYPFVRRLDAGDVASYRKSVDDGLKVSVANPELVSPECWNYLCYRFNSSEWYLPKPFPRIFEWHKHNPPPGTAYDPKPRLHQATLSGRWDATAVLDKLHRLAPYDSDIAYSILRSSRGNSSDYALATNLFAPVRDYANYAMLTIAGTAQIRSQPDLYEQLLTNAAELDPSDYFRLGDYFKNLGMDDKAAIYLEKGNATSPDSVYGSNYAVWLVKYYLKRGQIDKARLVADNGGEVYSECGLQAKAEFLEATGDPEGAFEWFTKIEDRYNDSGPLVGFCARYKAKTNDNRFDVELAKHMSTLFPNGLENVKFEDFKIPPTDGVVFTSENNLLRAAGIRSGDVVVAVYGIRVHDLEQYEYGRDLYPTPELDLILWQPRNQVYREIKSSPPNHMFGVDFATYQRP